MSSRLAIRTYYSLLWGTIEPQRLMERLKGEKIERVAITDRDNLYGLHTLREAGQRSAIEVLVAAELTCKEGSILAFVASVEGYSVLTRLLSAKKREQGFNLFRALEAENKGLILASLSPTLLRRLEGRVESLYAGVSPTNFSTVRLGLPLLALDDATLLTQEELKAHRVLRAIGENTSVGLLKEEPPVNVLLPYRLYRKALASWPEALKNTELVAKQCSNLPLFTSLVFPDYPNSSAELSKRVLAGAEEIFGELNDAILSRLEWELQIIVEKGFAPYFLTLSDIVGKASRTCGRGSGAASLVAYALGITNVDPLEHNLYFERFLNRERQDPPDLDVDFAWDERDAILQQTMAMFNSDHCGRVANHNRFRLRSALRETLRVYGLSKLPSDHLGDEIKAIATFLQGFPHHLSLHCGGVVITPEPISNYAVVETSLEGYPLLEWDKRGCEAAKLVKIDLLGNRSLAVVRDTLQNLKAEGILIDELTWRPIDDEATIAALARGDTMGVFYIESPAMRQLQKKSQKGDFEHIVIHSSIIRPAANKFIREYIRRLKGGHWQPLHPLLEEILGETYGIMCYQEDLSKVAIALAGFSEADADALRKVITKKRGAHLDAFRTRFFTGCLERKVEPATIGAIWEMMLSFEGYSFCKAHSASYAMLSFQSAYLRVHHPAQFMAAVLSNKGGYYHAQAYISECRRMGLKLIGPDVNQSRLRYYGQDNRLIIGLMAIANLSHKGSLALIEERRRGENFSCLAEFSQRVSLAKDDLMALVNAGVFDSLAPTLSRSGQLKRLLTGGAPFREQGELFTARPSPVIMPALKHTTTRDELKRELVALTFLREKHPLSLFPPVKAVKAASLEHYKNRYVSVVGWPITQKTVYTSAHEVMSFISFEDESALYEVVIFPAVYKDYSYLISRQVPLLIYGKVTVDEGVLSLEALRFTRIS